LGVATLGLLVTGIGNVAWVDVLQAQDVADIARAKRQQSAQRGTSGKVYTNEDVRGTNEPPTPPVAAGAAKPEGAAGKSPNGATAKKAGDAQAGAKPEEKKGPPEKSRAELEKEYRGRAAKLREVLDFEQKKLDVMQRELNLLNVQYYSDPNTAVREQTYRNQINTRTAEIEQQKVAADKASKAISDFEDELRKMNLPPGWAR
jgi:hypothetical protein